MENKAEGRNVPKARWKTLGQAGPFGVYTVDYVSGSALSALSLRSLSVTLDATKISFLPSSWNGPMKMKWQANNELQTV